MSVEIVFGVNLPTDQQTTVTDDDISRFNPVRTHTGKGDLSATLRGNRSLEQYAQRQDRINVNVSGETKWTGYLTQVSHDKGKGTTRIRADGVGKGLEETRPDYDSLGGPVTYSNVALHDALRDYWNRTPFDNHTVTDQDTEIIAEGAIAQSASTNTEWENLLDIQDTDPIYIDNGELRLAQTCWVVDGVETGSGGDVVQGADYSGGEAFALELQQSSVTLNFSPEYDIPPENVGMAVRDGVFDSDNNVDVRYEVDGEGVTYGQYSNDTLEWFYGDTIASPTINAGDSATARIRLETEPEGDTLPIDMLAVYDSRFNYTFDNDNGGSGGYLDGPELYPPSQTVETNSTTPGFNAASGTVTGTWNDTSNNQQIGVSNDGGQAYLRESNTDSIDKDFGSPGREVTAEITLSRFGERSDATPRTGYQTQSITDYELAVDGDDLVVLVDMELSRNHFDNLKQLHGFGDFLWVIEHDGGAIGDMVVSSFRRGDETRSAPDGFDNQVNQQPEIQSGTYYNSIYLEGAKRDDGTRPSAEVKDQDAIAADGREISPGVLRDLSVTTEAGAAYRARALLETAQQNNDLVGSVTVPPTITSPGYARPIDFGSGEQHKTVEEVSLSLGANTAEATFDFSVRSGFAEDISNLRRNAKDQGDQV